MIQLTQISKPKQFYFLDIALTFLFIVIILLFIMRQGFRLPSHERLISQELKAWQ